MRNLLILAKWLAGRADVDVVEYKGATACIGLVGERRVIRIPSHWSYSADPEAAELLEGVIDHEALGHGRFTDLEGRKKAEEAGVIKFTQLSAGIQNILEDIYIENKAIEAYPGVKRNLARTVEILESRGFFGSPDGFALAQGASLLTGGLLNILRSRLVPGQEAALQVNVDALEVVLPAMLGRLWDEVLAVAMEVQHSKSTADNIDLTVRIMKLIEEASEQEPQEAGAEEPQEETGEQTSDEAEAEEGPPSCTGGDQPSEPSSEGQGEADAEEGSPADADADPGPAPKTPVLFTQQEVDAAKSILESQDEEMPKTEIGEAISEEIQKSAKKAPRELTESPATHSISTAALKVASQSKNAADELQDALRSETRCERSIKLSGKRLNSRVLSRVRLGNSSVFQRKVDGEGISTAVELVLDFSSSMNAMLLDQVSRLDATVGLAYGLGDLLDEYDVPFQVVSYSEAYATMKAFGDDWTAVRTRRSQPKIEGGTWTGMAVQKALGDLVVRPEERKLMIVVTDGSTSDLDLLMSCYSEAQHLGVEVASVMVGPVIPSIQALAEKFGFKANSINTSAGLGRYAVEKVLEAI
jgi:cobaltochelatase CobT